MEKGEVSSRFPNLLPDFRRFFAKSCYKICYRILENKRKNRELVQIVPRPIFMQFKAFETSAQSVKKRQATLRILWPKGRVGSTPSFRTTLETRNAKLEKRYSKFDFGSL